MMIEITLHGRNGSRTTYVKPPRGFPTRHVRTRAPELPPEPPHSEPPVPVCPVLAALHKLTKYYPGGDGYFILDEIFLTVRQECTTFTRDTLLETLRSYYQDGEIRFRRGYGSQLQFAMREKK